MIKNLLEQTEAQLIQAYTQLINRKITKIDLSDGGPAKSKNLFCDFDELSAVIGRKYAYLVLTKTRFEASKDDHSVWYRHAPISDEWIDFEIDTELESRLRFARSAVDPKNLLKDFHLDG